MTESSYDSKDQALKRLLNNEATFTETLRTFEAPIDVYVSPSHPSMMENPLLDTSKYLPLESDRFAGGSSVETLRVKDNQLAREVLTDKKIDILDDRVKVATLNSADLNLIGSSRLMVT